MDEVYDIVQEAVNKNIPKKKTYKKVKQLSEAVVQITVERRDTKGKGEKERHAHLNTEFKRKARKDKKAFLSDQMQRNRGKQWNEKDQRYLQENQRYQGKISRKDGLNKGQK